MRGIRVAGALCVLALWLSVARADEPVKPRGEKITLQLNLKKGTAKTIAYRIEMNSAVTVQGQEFTGTMKMGMYLSAKVDDVSADKLHTIQMSYDRITLSLTAAGVDKTYDSKEPDKAGESPAFALFNAMVGQTITLKIAPDGTVKEMAGIDELAQRLKKKTAAGREEGKSPLSDDAIKQQLEGMKTALEQFSAFPDRPVDIGDSWKKKHEFRAATGMKMQVEATYTLTNRRNGVADVKMEGAMTADNGIKGKTAGTLHIDEATGWTTGGEMEINLAGETGGATVSLKGKTTISEK